MSSLDILRIKGSFEKQFDGLVDLSDLPEHVTNGERENHFLTRCLAAYSLTMFTDLEPRSAAACITDGSDDNGLDLVHFDRATKILYLIQSKWVKNGEKSPDAGEIHKFCAGVQDLIAPEFDRFNQRIRDRQKEIMDALLDGDTKIALIVSYTGKQKLSPLAARPIKDLVKRMNSTVEAFSYEAINLSRVYEAVLGQVGGKAIDAEITLYNYGSVTEPYKAYVGSMAAADLARLYLANRNNLFSKNLRNYRGSTEVNEAIQQTLDNDPESFLYLNNGLTVLCTEVKKKIVGQNRQQVAVFDCKGISIVNGAQTVGSITSVYSRHAAKVERASVLVRLLSLEDCPEGFGNQVTIASNTQNRVERVDFVAMDPEQKRLRTELLMEQKEYIYKAGDQYQGDGCTVTDATIALACANTDLTLAYQAKREVGKLWEMGPKSSYRRLFNPSLSSVKLWRAVEIMRTVDEYLKVYATRTDRKAELVTVHGNRFILHQVFARMPDGILEANEDAYQKAVGLVPALAREVANLLVKAVQQKYSNAYPANIFKNLAKNRDLDKLVNE